MPTSDNPSRPTLPSYGSLETRLPQSAPHRSRKNTFKKGKTFSHSSELLFKSSSSHPRSPTRSRRLSDAANRSVLSDNAGSDQSDDEVLDEALLFTRRRARAPSGIEILAAPSTHLRGVARMQEMTKYFSHKGYKWLYAGLYLISIAISLEANTTPVVEPYLLSSFGSHSFLGSISILTNLAYAVGKPPLAKIQDVFGRTEAAILSIALYGSGYFLTSISSGPLTFALARVTAALGGQGIQLSQQVIVADTTPLSSRALFTSTISLPWLLMTWIGPALGQKYKDAGEPGYRLSYLTFAILLPIASLPLILTLVLARRYSKKQYNQHIVSSEETTADANEPIKRSASLSTFDSRFSDSSSDGQSRFFRRLKEIWSQLDATGLLLLSASLVLILLPLSLSTDKPEKWDDPIIVILMGSGLALLTTFVVYERKYSKIPIVPARLVKQSTLAAGCALGFFHFVAQFVYESFFTSFLQVARYQSARDASYVAQSYIFSASIAALVCGLLVKKSQRYKRWVIVGVVMHIIGAAMMIRFRKLSNPLWELVLSQVIGGIGGGFSTLATQLGIQSVVTHQDLATATAFFLTVTQLGGAVGSSMSGSIWTAILPSRLKETLPEEHQADIDKIIGSLTYALSFEPGTPTRDAINEAYISAQRILNWMAFFALLPALIMALMMEDVKLGKNEGQEPIVRMGDARETDSETSSLL